MFNKQIIAGQHRSYALRELFQQLGADQFHALVAKSLSIGVFKLMPKRVAHFMSKVLYLHRLYPVHFVFPIQV